jgi:hypothetical protein
VNLTRAKFLASVTALVTVIALVPAAGALAWPMTLTAPALTTTTALAPGAGVSFKQRPQWQDKKSTKVKSGVKSKAGNKKAGGKNKRAKITPIKQGKVSNSNLPRLFGVHVPEVALGEWPSVPIGALRLWDSGTSWREIEPAKGQFDYTKLDAAVAAANSRNTPVLYVFGPTAQWAAADQKVDLRGPGAAADITNLKDWDDYVTNVVTRYKGKIESYQIWNEASEASFWRGTPERMAELTKRTCVIVKRIDPDALCVAPSTTTRRAIGFRGFFPPFLEALKKDGWPKELDVWAVHAYPVSTGKPADRRNQVQLFKEALTSAGAPTKPIWETELNFGLAGPGPRFPAIDFAPDVEAQLLKQAYLDSIALGLQRVYWYSWVSDGGSTQLGVILHHGTEAAKAFEVLQQWIGQSPVKACQDLNAAGTSKVCSFDASPAFSIAWSIDEPGNYVVAPGVTQACTIANVCQSLTPGQQLPVGKNILRIS